MSFSINGLASELNTAQIISDLMDVERIPYTNLETRKSNLQSEQAVFRQLNTKLSALQRLAGDLQLAATYEKSKGTFTNGSIGTVTVNGNATASTYTINVKELAKNKITAAEGLKGSDTNLTNATFSIGGKNINIASLAPNGGSFENNEAALKALVVEINKGDYGGKAAIIDLTGNGDFRLNITATKGGNADIDFTLGGTSSSVIQSANDAEIEINGVTVTRSTNEISDLIPGITLNLQSTGNSTLKVERDVEAITTQVENFVAAYNDLIKLVKTNLSKPEDADTVNPLQGDSTLKSVQNDLYNMITGMVFKDGSFEGFMEELGLSIDKDVKAGTKMTGEIVFDKTVFSKALAENPDKVTNIFVDRMTEMSTKLFDQYTSSTRGTLSMKITGYDSELKLVDEKLINMERKLEMKEARLKLQFNNMEVMLSSLKNEQDWLTSQFESLMNSSKK